MTYPTTRGSVEAAWVGPGGIPRGGEGSKTACRLAEVGSGMGSGPTDGVFGKNEIRNLWWRDQ